MSSQRSLYAVVLLGLISLAPAPILAQAAAAPSGNGSGQSTSAAQPRFDVVDIHPSPYSFFSTYFRISLQGTDRYLLRQATLLDMISAAYSIDQAHVLGGPTWLDFDRYEVTAKQPPATPADTSRLMLRTLLADRFNLVVHNDTRPMPAQILTVGKGTPKIKPAADTTVPSVCQFHPPATPPDPNSPPASYTYSCRNMTMEQYARAMPRFGPGAMAVVDQTGLKGPWDFDISYTLLPSRNGFDLANDLDKLGLKLATGETPQPVVVVDSVNEKPTPNSPKLAELLPPPPTPAFEVAVIKPSPPASRDMQIRFSASGQVNINGASLQGLISEAYDISGAMIADIPDFLPKDRWDVVGKIPQDDYPKSANGMPNVSFDDIKLMLRSLLEERFGMKTHFEDRPADAYVLSAVSPKLKKTADPKARTSCDERVHAGEKDPRATDPIRERLMICKNVTMAQFADQLEGFALDYIKSPVLDATHLEGSYDLTLNWSRSRVARGVEGVGGRPVTNTNTEANPTSNAAQAAEPTGAISLPDAVSRQLGLKLEQQKRPVPLLVLDHIERNPTEN
jgi:uncharacterized protein (TIGR03435 family)